MCKHAPDQTGVVYLCLILLSRLKREAESTLPSCKARVPPTGADAVLIVSEPPEKTWGATVRYHCRFQATYTNGTPNLARSIVGSSSKKTAYQKLAAKEPF